MPDDAIGSLRVNVGVSLDDLKKELGKIPETIKGAFSGIQPLDAKAIFSDLGGDKLRSDLDAYRKRLDEAAAAAERAGPSFKELKKHLDEISSTLLSAGTTLSAAITAPLVAAGVAAVKFGGDFDTEMRKVTSLLSGETDQAFKELSRGVLDLSVSMGVDAVKAAEGLKLAISSGIPKENALEFLKVASVAAIAGTTDTKVAVDGLTTVLQAFSIKATEATAVSDAMFQAVNVGKMEFPELAKAIGIAAGTAHALGISYTELLAATATLTNTTGQGASESMTMLQSAMKGVISPTKEMAEHLTKMGFASGEALFRAKGLEGGLNAIANAAGNNVTTLTGLFGRIEAVRGTLGLTGDNAKLAASHMDTMKHSSDGLGAAAKAAEENNKGFARQMEMLTAALKGVAIELGTALLPIIKQVAQDIKPFIGLLGDAAEIFGELPGPVKTTALALAAIAAGVGPGLLAIGGLVKGFTSLAAAVELVNAALAARGLTVALGAVASGAGLVTLAIGGAVAGGLALHKLYGDLQDPMHQAATGLAELDKKMNDGTVSGTDLFTAMNKVKDGAKESEPAFKTFTLSLDGAATATKTYNVVTVDLKKQLEAAQKHVEDVNKAVALGAATEDQATEARARLVAITQKMHPEYKNIFAVNAELNASIEEGNRVAAESIATYEQFPDSLKALREGVALAKYQFDIGLKPAADYAAAIDKLRAAQLALTDPVKKATDAFTIAGKEFSDGAITLNQYLNAVNDLINAAPAQKASIDSTVASVTRQNLSLGLLKQALDDTKGPFQTLDQALESIGQATIPELTRELNKAKDAFDIISAAFREGRASSDQVAAAWERLKAAQTALSQDRIDARLLGVEDLRELEATINLLIDAYNNLANKGLMTVRQSMVAQSKILEEQIRLHKDLGHNTDILQLQLDVLGRKLRDSVGFWTDLGRSIDTVLQRTSFDLARGFVDLFRNNGINDALDEQTADLEDALRKQTDSYSDFVSGVNEKISEVTTSNAENLQKQLDDLAKTTAAKALQYNRDVDNLLASQRKATQSIKEQAAQKELDYKQDVEAKTLALKQFEAKNRESLTQAREDAAQKHQEARDDYARTLKNMESDNSASAIKRRIDAAAEYQQEVRDIALALQQKERDLQLALNQEREDIQLSLQQRGEDMTLYRENEKVHLADSETALRDSLAIKAADYAASQAELVEKQTELTTAAKTQLDKQLVDLQTQLTEATAKYDAYKTDNAAKLAAIADQHQTVLDKIGGMFAQVFTNAGAALATFVTQHLVGSLFKELGSLVDDVLPSVAKAIGNVFGKGGVLGTSVGAAVGGIPGMPNGGQGTMGSIPTIPGMGGGGAGSAGSAGSSAASGVSGIAGIVGAIGSIGSMVSGIIGNFQSKTMNATLDLIEGNTRYSMIYLGGNGDESIFGALKIIRNAVATNIEWILKGINKLTDLQALAAAPAVGVAPPPVDVSPILNNLMEYNWTVEGRLLGEIVNNTTGIWDTLGVIRETLMAGITTTTGPSNLSITPNMQNVATQAASLEQLPGLVSFIAGVNQQILAGAITDSRDPIKTTDLLKMISEGVTSLGTTFSSLMEKSALSLSTIGGDVLGALWDIGRVVADTRNLIAPKLDMIVEAIRSTTTIPQINVTIQGNVIGNADFADQIANQIAATIREQGAPA